MAWNAEAWTGDLLSGRRTELRVIAGTARSLPLKTVRGNNTRPTTDRIKETLFNMISAEVPGCRFLDLFAGSGAIGIEALSRGAQCAAFVEQDRNALQVIRQNLNFTHLTENARVIAGDVIRTVTSMDGEKSFGVIFMDPPYDNELEKRVLEVLRHNSIADPDTLIIIEASNDTDFSYLDENGYTMIKDKHYGSNRHVFVRKGTIND